MVHLILTGGDDGVARIWESRNLLDSRIHYEHTGLVFSASWSPNGNTYLTAVGHVIAHIWDAANGA